MLGWLLGKRQGIDVDVASVSEQGLVRRDNQDNFFVDPRGALFCVADGMGGGQGGAKASEIVCSHLREAASKAKAFPELMKLSADAILEANSDVRAYAAERRWPQMGSTIAALFMDTGKSGLGVICHVGDSRIYRVRRESLELLTHDHTVAGEIGRRSSCLSDELTRRMGRLSHILTRAVGIEETVIPDWRKIDIREGDVYMICSDGIYDMIDKNFIRDILSKPAPAADIVGDISRAVMDAGAHDNFTCIVIKIGGAK